MISNPRCFLKVWVPSNDEVGSVKVELATRSEQGSGGGDAWDMRAAFDQGREEEAVGEVHGGDKGPKEERSESLAWDLRDTRGCSFGLW